MLYKLPDLNRSMKITAITPFPSSHVAGIIAGDGTLSGGHIQGIAPQAFIVSVRVLREAMALQEADVA